QFTARGARAFVAFPEVSEISPTLKSAPLDVVELTLPWSTRQQKQVALRFIKENRITSIYFTDRSYANPQYARLRLSGVTSIVVHDHTPGDRPRITGLKGALKAARNKLP